MSVWNELEKDPFLVPFHDDTLNMLDVTTEYIHIRLSISSNTYFILENDLKNVYIDHENNELYFDMVFFESAVDEDSEYPSIIKFEESYSILSLERDGKERGALYFQKDNALNAEPVWALKFSYGRCMVKKFAEMPSKQYNSQPEIYDKRFDLEEFLLR
ncbi:MAG: hypothetical protein IJY71_04915 [Clostridia bacterium]|nr:hypothetical protein [Clostridia bacterium]